MSTGSANLRAFPEESLARSPRGAIVIMLILTAVLSFVGLGMGPDLSDHEAIVAQGAREILQTGDWLVPHVNGEPFVRKPPLPFWLVAAAAKLVDPAGMNPPVSLLAARLPSAIAGWLTALLVFAIGRRMFGLCIGVVAALIQATCAGGLLFSHRAEVEMTLTFFSAATFAAFWMATEPNRSRPQRGWLLAFYFALALAMLAKAPLPGPVVMLPLAVWWFVVSPLFQESGPTLTDAPPNYRQRVVGQCRHLPSLLAPLGILLFVAIVVPWPLYVYRHVDHVMDLWRLEFVARYTGDMSESAEPFWYYLPMLFVLALPFALSLPEAVASPFLRAYESRRRPLAFVFTWLAVHVVFVSTGAYKRTHYLATCAPAMALLLAPTLDRLFLAARNLPRRAVAAITISLALLAVAGAIAATVVVHRQWPALQTMTAVAAGLFGLGIATACHSFFHGRRAISLLSLIVTIATGFAWTWRGLGIAQVADYKPIEMAVRIKAANLPADARLTWAIGRPDVRLAWHLGRPVRPLFDALELANLRSDRKAASEALQLKFADRIAERMRGDKPEYLVIDAKYWAQFRSLFEVPARELARIHDPFDDDKRDDWLLLTNRLE